MPAKGFFGRSRVIAVTLFLFISPGLAAQDVGDVAGRVRTADGQPVSDAIVTVVGTRMRAEADEDGRFTLESVAVGAHLLEVVSRRHAQAVERVTVIAGETVEVEVMVVSRVHSERIVVTASPRAHGELDLATPVGILDGHELALRLEPTIGQSLQGEAGVSSTWFAAGASRPIIRGLGGDRVKMMENGIDVLDASSASPDHAVAVDPMAAERIEVVRGPATLLYGGNAIGGVVNVIDQRIPRFRPSEGLSGMLNLRTGSAADERATSVDLGGGGDRWAWNLHLLDRQTGDYEIPGRASVAGAEPEEEEGELAGVVANSDVDSSSAGFGASYFFGGQGYLGLSVRGFDSRYGVPGGEHGEHHADEEHGEHVETTHHEHAEEGIRIDLRQRRYDLEAGITRSFGPFRGASFRVGWVDYEHAELEGPGVVGTEFFNDAWEARAELVQKARGPLAGSLGVQLRRRDLEAIGEEAFIAPAVSESLGIFTFQELDRGSVRYQVGLRYEIQDTTIRHPELPDRRLDGLSASLGVVWQPSETWSLGASLARSVKLPSSEELYSGGLHFATSSFELGDSGLGEETALGLDLTLRKVDGRLTGAFNLFYNDFTDYIFQRFTGAEVEGFPVLQWSHADAVFWGAELDASILLAERAHSSWDLDLVWDFVRAELDDGGDLPRIPPQRFGVGVHYRSDRLRAGAEVRRVEDQDRIAENESPTDGYVMVNANVSYRFLFESYFVDVILRGTNLGDEEARMHTSFVKDDVPLPGRSVGLVLRLGF